MNNLNPASFLLVNGYLASQLSKSSDVYSGETSRVCSVVFDFSKIIIATISMYVRVEKSALAS